MTQDGFHCIATLLAVSSLCGGTYLLAGLGAALCLFGGLVLSGVIYARRTQGVADAQQPD